MSDHWAGSLLAHKVPSSPASAIRRYCHRPAGGGGIQDLPPPPAAAGPPARRLLSLGCYSDPERPKRMRPHAPPAGKTSPQPPPSAAPITATAHRHRPSPTAHRGGHDHCRPRYRRLRHYVGCPWQVGPTYPGGGSRRGLWVIVPIASPWSPRGTFLARGTRKFALCRGVPI